MMNFGLQDKGEITCITREKYLSGCYFPVVYRIREMLVAGERGCQTLPLVCCDEWFVVTAEFEKIYRDIEGQLDAMLESGEQPYCYIIHELPQYIPTKDGYLREWLCLGENYLLGESVCCHNVGFERFMGRSVGKILHREGERVEVVFDDRVEKGVVVRTPPTESEVRELFDTHRQKCLAINPQATDWHIYTSFPLGYDDDVYEVLLSGGESPVRVHSSRVVKGIIMW